MIESYYALGWRILKVKGCSNKDLIFHSGYIINGKFFYWLYTVRRTWNYYSSEPRR
ncbi:hypothetical protein [Rickettsia peacockii]|uniref:hypothetical protein n=1 Tax=Rickettsia peacockii TaxID=47589 RepID=UPI00030AD546|nr:hypothetical protein [Rickettsia peacockii]